MSKKGGRDTPDDIDYLFERSIIDPEDYVEFWVGYWERWDGGDKYEVNRQQQEYIDEWLQAIEQSREELEAQGQDTLHVSGVVTKSKEEASKQAVAIGGKVVRRDAKGRFSKTGDYFQAVHKGKRRKT